MTIRSFIAIPVPKDMANALGDVAAQMAYQDKSNAIRWVDQNNYHITLAFLADQEEPDLEQLAAQLDMNLQENCFAISVGRCTPFPEARPKLIAAMVTKDTALQDLHRQVMASISASPIYVEKRRFMPHITLGRYRHSKNRFAGAITTSLSLSADIEEVSVYQSILTPAGAEYEALFRFPLEDYEYFPDEV